MIMRYDKTLDLGAVRDVVAVVCKTPAGVSAKLAEVVTSHGIKNMHLFPGPGQKPTPAASAEVLQKIMVDIGVPDGVRARLTEAIAPMVRAIHACAKSHTFRYDAASDRGVVRDAVCLAMPGYSYTAINARVAGLVEKFEVAETRTYSGGKELHVAPGPVIRRMVAELTFAENLTRKRLLLILPNAPAPALPGFTFRYDDHLDVGAVRDVIGPSSTPNKEKTLLKKYSITLKHKFPGLWQRPVAVAPAAVLKAMMAELHYPDESVPLRICATLDRTANLHAVAMQRRIRHKDGQGAVYDIVAMALGVPLHMDSKVYRKAKPLLEKYSLTSKVQFAPSEKSTYAAPFSVLEAIATELACPEAVTAIAALKEKLETDAAALAAALKSLRWDADLEVGALYDVGMLAGAPKSSLDNFKPTMCITHKFSGTGQVPVVAAPPDVLSAAAEYLGRPDLALAITNAFPARLAILKNMEVPRALSSVPPRAPSGYVTPRMVLEDYATYYTYEPLPYTLHLRAKVDEHTIRSLLREEPAEGEEPAAVKDAAAAVKAAVPAPPPAAAPAKATAKKKQERPRIEHRMRFSEAWMGRVMESVVTWSPDVSQWYYWPADRVGELWAAMEEGIMKLLVCELIARGLAEVREGGACSVWDLVDAAGKLSLGEARRLGPRLADQVASELGPWPAWRGVEDCKLDYVASKPMRGPLFEYQPGGVKGRPRFLEMLAPQGVTSHLCRYEAAPSKTFWVARGISLLTQNPDFCIDKCVEVSA